jgi:spermidine synthase
MTRWEFVEQAAVPGGASLTLARRGEEFVLRAGPHVLMNSRAHGSEDALGHRGCEALRAVRSPRVLVGGLGMGFTLRAALEVLPADARVDVVELLDAVLRWNLGPLGPLAGHPLADPRVTARAADVGSVIAAARTSYDAILLDVDNGPTALTARSNAGLYGPEGLGRARAALRPAGVLAVWSAGEDRAFSDALRGAGFSVRVERARARGAGAGAGPHVLWLARVT